MLQLKLVEGAPVVYNPVARDATIGYNLITCIFNQTFDY